MKVSSLHLLIAVLAVIVAFVFFYKTQMDLLHPFNKNSLPGEYPIPLVRLLSRPEIYHKKEVSVIGFLHLEFEGNAVYFHQEDFENQLYKNGIWLDLGIDALHEYSQLTNKYVVIVGEFDAKRYGHGRLFSGSINNIKSIDRL